MVRDGYLYGFALFAVAALVGVLTHTWGWALIPVALACFFLWFFRDPRRAIPQGEGLVVSPADGKITAIQPISTRKGEVIRVSIFLNVFDVHVNRSPVAGTIRKLMYHKGEFMNAMAEESAERNERNICVVDSPEGYSITFTQIAGLLARRIVFRPKVGDRLERGQRVGLIKFGSRTDIVLPGDAVVEVSVGERVRGGATVLARVAPRTAVGERNA